MDAAERLLIRREIEARAIDYWYEIDITYYVIKMLSWVGLTWDLRKPPQHVLDGNRVADHEDIGMRPGAAEKPGSVLPPMPDPAE